MRSTLLFSLLITSINCLNLYAAEPLKKRSYETSETATAPRIDGIIDDNCWNTGVWGGDFIQQHPTSGGVPSQQTLFKIIYDYDNIYVAIVSLDTEPDKIRPIFDRRDEFAGDIVGIAFDSYNDKRTAFEFNVTCAGQKIDLKHSGDKDYDLNWNAIWDAATSINDSGWVAEMRIPFSQLRYNKANQDLWGLHVWRWIQREKEESQWQLIPPDASAMVYLFGELNGIQNIRSSRQVEFLPYASAKLDYKGDQDNPFVKKLQPGLNAGIDAKIGISSNFTLDATIYPDFGQVEADPSQLNLTSYETFFDEKRPFFLEGKEILDFKIDRDQLFYSRRIGSKPSGLVDIPDSAHAEKPDKTRILGSLKLSGKSANGLSIGILNSVTSVEYASIYGAEDNTKQAIEPYTNYFVGRIKKESNNANTIYGANINSVIRINHNDLLKGGFTNTATTGGVDFTQYWKNRDYFVSATLAGSYIEGGNASITNLQESHLHRFQRSDADHLSLDTNRTSLSGSGGTFGIGKQGGQLKFGANVNYWSPQFNINDLGFMRNADVVEEEAYISYESVESKGFLRKYHLGFEQELNTTFGGEITNLEFQVEGWTEFQNLWNCNLMGNIALPTLDTRELWGGPALMTEGYGGGHFYGQTNSSKDLMFSTHAGYWQSFESPSTNYHYGATVRYHPINQINISLNSTYEKDYDLYQYIYDGELGDQGIYLAGTMDRDILNTTLRIEYYLTPELSIQYYGSPYFSVGKYADFKKVSKPHASSLQERYYHYQPDEYFYDEESEKYHLNQTGQEEITLSNPDFSYAQFRSNLILRWEYKLGSVFYFVWAHEQTNNKDGRNPTIHNSIGELFDAHPGDVLMIKFTYWFSI